MKKITYIILAFLLVSVFSSCKKEVIRGTQTPKNVIEVEGVGKIGQMAKHYDFREKFLPCWDYGFSDNEDFGRWCVGEKGFLIFKKEVKTDLTEGELYRKYGIKIISWITADPYENYYDLY